MPTAASIQPLNVESPVSSLPEVPLIVIEPSRSWLPVNLREVWNARELLYFLAWRDLKVRYKQTVLGVLWVVMQPVLMTFIFTIFLGRVARVPTMGQIPYPIFAYSGLLLWTFFAGAISAGGNSLLASAPLITKIYFPRLIIPYAAVLSRLIDLSISFVLLAALMIVYRVPFTSRVIWAPVFGLLLIALALGFSVLTSALTVKYRDIGIAMPVMIQLWLFVSPIVYPVSLVPSEWQRIYALNPVVGIVEGFRACLFNFPINRWAFGISVVVTTILLVYSAYAFRRIEKIFADLV